MQNVLNSMIEQMVYFVKPVDVVLTWRVFLL
jgi:hypothetical protein